MIVSGSINIIGIESNLLLGTIKVTIYLFLL